MQLTALSNLDDTIVLYGVSLVLYEVGTSHHTSKDSLKFHPYMLDTPLALLLMTSHYYGNFHQP